jgi:hypothetical protein
MKQTAVNGILERIKQLSINCDSPDSKWVIEMLIRDIETGTEYDKSFLEIERDQLMFSFDRGHSDTVCSLSGIKKRESNSVEFYNEYFKK